MYRDSRIAGQIPAPSRRETLARLLAAGWTLSLSKTRAAIGSATSSDTISLGNRAHFTARPALRDKLIWCFSTVLECGAPAALHAAGITEPILAFRFPGGGSISIEFNSTALDERDARRGAWLEIQTENPDALKHRILAAGLEKVEYAATTTFYFAAPGGQVFGVIDKRRLQAEVRHS